MTGLNEPYERPLIREVIVDTEHESVAVCSEKIPLSLAAMGNGTAIYSLNADGFPAIKPQACSTEVNTWTYPGPKSKLN